jgi:hypothetical protein
MPNKKDTDMSDDLYDKFANELGLETAQARLALSISCENLKLFDRKQKDYGSGNISNNPMPEFGVAIRANDKVQRIMNLLGKESTECEAREDSWMDLANYGIIGYMVSKGLWK